MSQLELDLADTTTKEHFEKSSSFDRVEECEEMKIPAKCVSEKRNNFSIDYILGITRPNEQQSPQRDEENCKDEMKAQYDWLHYTRYKPPKLQSKIAWIIYFIFFGTFFPSLE